jgi:hypothetical protein
VNVVSDSCILPEHKISFLFTFTFHYLLVDMLSKCIHYRIRSVNGPIWLVFCVHLEAYVCSVDLHQDHLQVWDYFLCQVWSLADWPTQVRTYSIALLHSKLIRQHPFSYRSGSENALNFFLLHSCLNGMVYNINLSWFM